MPKYIQPHEEFVDLNNTSIPAEVLNTGDPAIIQNCLNTNKTLSFQDQQVLQGRLDSMNYVSELVAEQADSKHQPLKAYQTENGWQLPAMNELHQTTANGCWAMPVQMMLKSRGIEVPQMVIRDYRPVISGPASAGMTEEQTRELNTDTANNMARGAELIQRLLPNTMVFQGVYGSGELPLNDKTVSVYKNDLKKQVTGALSEGGSPVALLIGGHYRTIVGIDGDDLIIKDSLKDPVDDERLSLDEVFELAKHTNTQSVEISWIKDMDAEKGAVDTEVITEAFPFIERKGNNLSIDPAVFDDLTAGKDSRFSDFSYEDQGVFSNTLNVQMNRGRAGQYIRDAIIFPKTLTPNVKELEPIETYQPLLPEKAADPDAIIPDSMTAYSINDVDYDGPDEEETPEQHIEEKVEVKKEPEQPQTVQTQEEFVAQKKAEAKKMSKADAIKTMIDAAPPLTKPEEKTEPAKPEKKAEAKTEPEQPKEKPQAPAQNKSKAKKMNKAEQIKAAIDAAPPLVKPEEKAPAENMAAPASAAKTPVQQPVQQGAKQPEPVQQPVKQPVQQSPKQISADQYPTAADATNIDSMLDNEISNYFIPSSSYKSKYMDVDMYPPKPSMLKELCKSFGAGLIGMVRKLPILGSIVGFFADVITNAVESYDNLMEKLDAQRPFMAGEDVYNIAVYNVIKKAPKTPETAKLFADPKFQQSLVQFAAQDPDLNYAATHNHSPEFYKKYMMSEKGFNKLSEKFTKQVLKGIDMLTAKPELPPDVAKKMKAMQAAEKQKKQQQKQKQQNQPKINTPSIGPK